MCRWLFLLIFVASTSAEICPNITALHNVSAHFNLFLNDFTDYEDSINFYQLENQTVIHVVKANVSVLCEGMVNSFRRLQHLAFNNANISVIQAEAFKQVPNLHTLSFAVNHLTMIRRVQFKNLHKLVVLYLSGNKITTIDEDAFSELPNLKKIFLDKNKLFEVDSKWFLHNPKLLLINLAYNQISKLQRGAFTLKKNSVMEIRLQHNVIDEIEGGVVASPEGVNDEEKPHVRVIMAHNNLTTIPNGFVTSMQHVYSTWDLNSNLISCVSPEVLTELVDTWIDLKITNNPLNCPCMQDITNFKNEHDFKGNFEYTSIHICYLYGVQTPPEWDSPPAGGF